MPLNYRHWIQGHEVLVEKAIAFFTAKATNPELFGRIKGFRTSKEKFLAGQIPNFAIAKALDYFTALDFMLFEGEYAQQKGIPSATVDWVIDRLCAAGILAPASMLGARLYATNEPLARFLFERDCIYNALFGFNFIVEKYSQSVFKIVVKDESGDSQIGTGFLMRFTRSASMHGVVLTNEHVARYEKQLRVLGKDNVEIEHSQIIHSSKSGEDLAIIELITDQALPAFHLDDEPNILDEVITLGFPNVAMTRDSYQLAHRGEMNAIVLDRAENELLLFSAKTAPGNSGSPLVNSYGMVVGIVTEDLFYKDALIEKGQLPYHAAIPASTIRQFLKRDCSL